MVSQHFNCLSVQNFWSDISFTRRRHLRLWLVIMCCAVLSSCASETQAPSERQAAAFAKQLCVGSYIFTIVRDYNGSQSVIYVPTIFRVAQIEGDYVHVSTIHWLDSELDASPLRYWSAFDRAEYMQLKKSIKRKTVSEITDDSDASPAESIRTALRGSPRPRYFFWSSSRVFSARSLREDGALVPYYRWAEEIKKGTPQPYGAPSSYVDHLTGSCPAVSDVSQEIR